MPVSLSINLIIHRARVDLPDPLSPTTPSVSPLRSSIFTSDTASIAWAFLPKPKKLRPPPNDLCRALVSTTTSFDRFLALRGFSRGMAAISDLVYLCFGLFSTCVDVPLSTINPSCMTITRSAISATTPKSWVMKRTPVPNRLCMSLISRNICAWVVTSSAVVGSSAINIFGPRANAIAIIDRCR